MKTHLRLVALLIPMVLVASNSYAAVKAGSACTKVGTKSVSGGKSYNCIKSGKKLVWDKGVVVPAKPAVASPAPSVAYVPEIPTSFENLYQNRKGIAYAAWSKTAEVMSKSSTRIPDFKSFVGPNTKPWYSDNEKVFGLVSNAFPTAKIPSSVIVIYYNYPDISWAEDKLKTLISTQNYDELNRNERGHLVDSNCQPEWKDCMGAKEVTTHDGTDIAILLMGVTNSPGMVTAGGGKRGDPGLLEGNITGQILAHEYFHALQREEQVGRELTENDWPPRWITEGSAQFFQNSIVYSGDFAKYANWRQIAVGDNITRQGITYEFVVDFMDMSNYYENSKKFDGDWSYFLGARIVEALVAIKGPGSVLDFYRELGQRKGFEISFLNAFGANYRDVVPIIARSISENWKSKN